MRAFARAIAVAAERLRGREAAAAAGFAATAFLIAYAVVFCVEAWKHGPGPDAAWYAWWDQSQYLKSARAFARFDLDPNQHLYPPLYALMAAPFAWLFPYDPFLFVNLACFAASAALLVLLFGPVTGRIAALLWVAGFFITFPEMLVKLFIVPWTSTPATAFILGALWLLMRLDRERATPPLRSFLFSLLLGLIVPTRPLDALVAAALYPFWLAGLWRVLAEGAGRTQGRSRLAPMLPHLAALFAGGVVGCCILLGANLLMHGSLLSQYVSGLAPLLAFADLGEKFVSLFADSASLYVEPRQVIFWRFPWAIAAPAALLVCIALGSLWLRAAATLVALQFIAYLPFVDLLPNGLYRYENIHYFRWALWLSFMMLPVAAILAYRRCAGRWRVAAAAAAIVSVLFAGMQFRVSESAAPYSLAGERMRVSLPADRATDYVDIEGFGAGWQATYFTGPAVWRDGRPLSYMAEFRALPTQAGTRLVFIRPMNAGVLEVSFAGWRRLGSEPQARTGTASLAFGLPRWLMPASAAPSRIIRKEEP